jgi:hypothetical protein
LTCPHRGEGPGSERGSDPNEYEHHDNADAALQAAHLDRLRCELSAAEGDMAEAAAQLSEAEAELEQQAALLEAQAQQIHDLTQQLLEVQRCGGQGAAPLEQEMRGAGGDDAGGEACYVQLPADSYQPGCCGSGRAGAGSDAAGGEDCGCCWWRCVAESWQEHPGRWVWGGVAAAALLVLLCATIIPARHRSDAPRWVLDPTVSATGSSWVDATLQLDRPGTVSWMAVPTGNLSSLVEGTDSTLLELLQAGSVPGDAIVAASSAVDALRRSQGRARGLEQLATACGWAAVEAGRRNATVSMLSVPGSAAAACRGEDTAAHLRCSRCPRLLDSTAYTVLLVAAAPGGGDVGGVRALAAQTGASSGLITSTDPPYIANATAISFELHFKLQMAGTVRYVVQHASVTTPYQGSELYFAALPPAAGALLSVDPAAFLGGVVAVGEVEAAAPGEWTAATVQPPCAPPLCNLSLHALLPNTCYQVLLLAEDSFGNSDAAPAVLPLTTAAGGGGPALLPPSGPANVTGSGFDVAVSMDGAGAIYYMLLSPRPGAGAGVAGLAAGTALLLDALPRPRRRRQLAWRAGSGGRAGGRRLDQDGRGDGGIMPPPGSLLPRTCPLAARACGQTAAAAFAPALAGLASVYSSVAAGCAPVPVAGQPLALPTFQGLQNDTTYFLLLSTESLQAGAPPPPPPPPPTTTVFAVRTVDLSPPRQACGFPAVTNISSRGFALSVMLTKPAAAFFVAVPGEQAGAPPSAADVLQGRGPGGGAAAAFGRLSPASVWGSGFPWEAQANSSASGGSLPLGGDELKMWSNVTTLVGGSAYTVSLALLPNQFTCSRWLMIGHARALRCAGVRGSGGARRRRAPGRLCGRRHRHPAAGRPSAFFR